MKTLGRFSSLNKQFVVASMAVVAIVAQLGVGVIFSQAASAAGETKQVTNETELRAELQAGNSVELLNDIQITDGKSIIIGSSANLTISGVGGVKKIEGVNFPNGYVPGGDNYVFKVYKSTVTFSDVDISGANAAIHVNQSNVTLAGTVNVAGEWGGIEVSPTNSQLNLTGTILHAEANGKPAVWVDGANSSTINMPNMFWADFVKPGQIQYYASPATVGAEASIGQQLFQTMADAEAANATINGEIKDYRPKTEQPQEEVYTPVEIPVDQPAPVVTPIVQAPVVQFSSSVAQVGPTYSESVAVETETKDNKTDTKKAEKSEDKKDDQTSGKLFGIDWYWWIIFPVVLVAVWWLIVFLRRKYQD